MNEIKGVEDHLKKKESLKVVRIKKERRPLSRIISSPNVKAVGGGEVLWKMVGVAKDPSMLSKPVRNAYHSAIRSCQEQGTWYVLWVVIVNLQSKETHESVPIFLKPNLAKQALYNTRDNIKKSTATTGYATLYRMRKMNGVVLVHDVE